MTLPAVPRKPLLVLVADLDIENAIVGLFSRFRSLRIRELKQDRDFTVVRHRNRDAGCRTDAPAFLSQFPESYEHALVVFDRDGCGKEDRSREEIESELETELSNHGWGSRSAVVCIAPELEAWVWSISPKVAEVLGWTNRETAMRDWLVGRGQLRVGTIKPDRPKEALECVLRELRRSRSASIYRELAMKVGLNKCEDTAFSKLKSVLRQWFPEEKPVDQPEDVFCPCPNH